MKLPQILLDWSFSEGSSVTVQSANPTKTNALGEQEYGLTQSYNGPANVYDAGGSIVDDVLGALTQNLLKVIITATPATLVGLVQQIAVGDQLTINGDPTPNRYVVQHTFYWDAYPYSLELTCNLEKG